MNIKLINTLVTTFAEEFKPLVDKIEDDNFPTTMYHYGEYLEILSGIEHKSMRFVLAIALIRSNANKKGVVSALKLCDQEMGFKLESLVEEDSQTPLDKLI